MKGEGLTAIKVFKEEVEDAVSGLSKTFVSLDPPNGMRARVEPHESQDERKSYKRREGMKELGMQPAEGNRNDTPFGSDSYSEISSASLSISKSYNQNYV